MLPSQMLKGVLEGAILKVLSQQPSYAYKLSEILSQYGFGNISEGTIYPMLLRLKANGYIISETQASSSGPKRKYYHLTKEGRAYLVQFEQDWINLKIAVEQLFGKENI